MTDLETVGPAVALMRQALRLLDDAEAEHAACHLQHAIDAALRVPLPVPHIMLPPLDRRSAGWINDAPLRSAAVRIAYSAGGRSARRDAD